MSDDARREAQDRLLAELKTETEARNIAEGHTEKGTPAALAAGALGKFASAVADERGQDVRDLMREVKPCRELPSEERIAADLYSQAVDGLKKELEEHGTVPAHSVGAKMQAAAEKYERMMMAEASGKTAAELEGQMRTPRVGENQQRVAEQHQQG